MPAASRIGYELTSTPMLAQPLFVRLIVSR